VASHYGIAELLETVIMETSVKSTERTETSAARYGSLIVKYAKTKPTSTYLRTYENKLIKNYYSTSAKYETEEQAWEIIHSIS
jgi:hypothetical protein